jgi:anti-sigma B factor antagonist
VTNAKITLGGDSDIPIVSVVGEIDAATAPLLIDRLEEIPEDASKVVIDLSETTFIDSSGLSALVACRKRLNDLGSPEIRIVTNRPTVVNLFTITGLLDTFPVVATLEEAVAD